MKIKNLVLGVGIIIVFALVLWQGVEAFYPSPSYQDFCEETERVPPIEKNQTEENQRYTECFDKYQEARNEHSKVVFFISLIVALIVILTGYKILSIEPVGSALIGSGIWSIFWGSVVNWQNFPSISRFVILLIALVLLVWLTIKLNQNHGKKKSN